ncbi:hypothetical protein H0H87_004723 [Tephrocybe sp. NHM501043]|nr:hypothetical protein H0H87_004723 [Tephrocybe sp. NHM501043]
MLPPTYGVLHQPLPPYVPPLSPPMLDSDDDFPLTPGLMSAKAQGRKPFTALENNVENKKSKPSAHKRKRLLVDNDGDIAQNVRILSERSQTNMNQFFDGIELDPSSRPSPSLSQSVSS